MILLFQGARAQNKVYGGDKRINIVTIIVLAFGIVAILFCLRFHFRIFFFSLYLDICQPFSL